MGYTSLWDGIRRRYASDRAEREAAELALVSLLHKTFCAFDVEVARRPAVYKVNLVTKTPIAVKL